MKAAYEIAAAVAAGDETAVSVVEGALARAQTAQRDLNAFITITEEEAMQQAERADQLIKEDHCEPLTGIPLAIKDVICTRGLPTTCGSKILENFVFAEI